jgi:hypothetical protein
MISALLVSIASCLVGGATPSTAPVDARSERPFLAPDQIAWQRSLDDARAMAAAEQRPLLVAINLDGESSSDRIVPERYRNPEFVAWTRRFVCVIGHPLRHTPRDHDDLGRRIECPRLGSVTCGEHVALEPQLFDAYLGGERISPRHALILPDGTKAFDLFLLFDMVQLDDTISKAFAVAPPELPPDASIDFPGRGDSLIDSVIGARASCQRRLLEWGFSGNVPGGAVTTKDVFDAIRAVGRVGNPGSIELVRLILQARPAPDPGAVLAIEGAAAARGFLRDLARTEREILSGAGAYPGSAALGGERRLLPSLGRITGGVPEMRALILAQSALAPAADRAAARDALAAAFSKPESAAIERAVTDAGGPLDLEDVLRLGAETAASGDLVNPIPADPQRTADELARELEAAEQELSRDESDARAARRFGMANLALARARIASSGPGVGLLLQDADTWLARAAEALPDDELLAIERARSAYYLSRFDEEARIAGELLEHVRARLARTDRASAVLERWEQWGSGAPTGRDEAQRAAMLSADGVALEALRWAGDAEGRRLGADAADPARTAASLARGARALAYACASRGAQDVDYQSLASYLGAVGMSRSSLTALRAGLQRFPASSVLRDMTRDALVGAGRVDVLSEWSDWIAGRNPESAACAWYAGYAHFLAAEWARRAEDSAAALAAYAAAADRFHASLALEPAYAESAGHYLAACELGRGFAQRMAGRRQDAADCLARALALRPAIGAARDGLDREAVDLVDAVLEWTAAAASDVDPIAFADELERAVPGETRWVLAVADSCLREGLRADGRVHVPIELPRAMRRAGTPAVVDEPTELGDRWLQQSIDVARLALAVRDDVGTRRYLAQSLTVQAERELVRGLDAAALPRLEEAARLLEEPAQSGESPIDVARRLRESLGEARPVNRPGR